MRNWHPLPLFKHTNHKIDDRGIFAAGTMALLWLAPCSISTPVAGAEVADINWDGSPEIYVYVTSASSGSYGSLVAYLANRRKSLSEIHLPPVTQEKTLSEGYIGDMMTSPWSRAFLSSGFRFTVIPTQTPILPGHAAASTQARSRRGRMDPQGRQDGRVLMEFTKEEIETIYKRSCLDLSFCEVERPPQKTAIS